MNETKSLFKVTVEESFESVPVGGYRTKFLRVEEAEGSKEYGPALRWCFEVTDGALTGKLATALTGTKFTAKTNAGKLLSQLQGKALEKGQTVDLSQFIGQVYAANVIATESGSTKVDSVFRV
jgi:hypothetical protein